MAKKMACAAMACAMASSMCLPVFAGEAMPAAQLGPINTSSTMSSKPRNEVPMTLDILGDDVKPLKRFSVAVPTHLPVVMDTAGTIMVATNAEIRNHSNLSVQVSDVTVTPASGWALKNYGDNIGSEAAGSKFLGVQINNCDTTTEGLTYSQDQFPVIDVDSAMPVTYKAKMPRQEITGSVGTVATTVFVIGWGDGSVVSSEFNPSLLQQYTKYLSGTIAFTPEKYKEEITGNAYDISAAQDKSVICVVDGQNAMIYGDGSVMAPASCDNLFYGFYAKEIDVSGLDTSKTTSMYCMFYNMSNLERIIGLNQFDTKHVTNMSYMFDNGGGVNDKLKEIDLSSFDMKNVTDLSYMFTNRTNTTKIICRTQEDMEKLKTNGGHSNPEVFEVVGSVPETAPETPADIAP